MGNVNKNRNKKNNINFADLALLEDELHAEEEKIGLEKPLALWQKLGDRYFEWQEHRTKHMVKKKTYLILTALLGWAGIHRFYEKRWKLGIFYLALCWTGFPVALAVVDFLIALPMAGNEDGEILI